MNNQFIRCSIRSLYDMQNLRIQNGNRICAAFRHKLGLNSSQLETDDEEAHKLLTDLRKEYKRITDGVKRITINTKIDSPLISNIGELSLLEAYELQLEAEAKHEKLILSELNKEKIWTNFLVDIKGIGPLMAGVILSEIDIHKCNSISALWAYAGLDVVTYENENGETISEGRCKKAHHLVDKEYYSESKKETIKTKGITYNPMLKTKMVHVLATSFLRLNNPEYRSIYDGYKHRLENHPKHKDKTKGHKHNMSTRAMIKEFLADLWTEWRIIEGLPVRSRYAEEKLGIVHSKPRKAA